MRGLLGLILCVECVLVLGRGDKYGQTRNAAMDRKTLVNVLENLTGGKVDKQVRRTNKSWGKLMGLLFPRAWSDEEGCDGGVARFDHEGELTSPDYPNNYPNYAYCQYVIEAPKGKVVKLEFPEFDIEDQTSCVFDSVSVFDGSNATGEYLGCYCGNLPGLTFLSESNAIFFDLWSEWADTKSGYKAVWTFHDAYSPVDKEESRVSCDKTFKAESGLIQSPVQTGSNQYPNNTRCVYSITAPSGKTMTLRFERFCLEQDEFCSHDKVEIYDGESVTSDPLLTRVYCGGNMPPDLTSTGSSLTVVFSTNEIKTGSGFTAHWTTEALSSSTLPVPWRTPVCGVPKARSCFLRLLEGAEVIPNSYPWQVQILKNGDHWCGGSIIANYWIITAAHCVVDDVGLYTVRVGEHNRMTDEGTETDHTVEKLILHDRFELDTFDCDIALLRLSTPITFTDNVSPICLPPSDPQVGLLCTTTGWGEIASKLSDVLMGISVPIISRIDCNTDEMYNGSNTVSMFCAGYPEGKADSCQGDSGGPLVCLDPSGTHMTLYGITSWGNGCAQPNKPGVYTRVSRFTGWIDAKTGVRPPLN